MDEELLVAIGGIIIMVLAAAWFLGAYGIFWSIVFVTAAVCAAHFLIKQAKEDKAKREAYDRQLEAQRAAYVAQQESYETQILAACHESVVAFEDIPKNLMTADQLLDTAEYEFKDSAFSPFWDSIERAMQRLGTVDEKIKLIADRSNRYKTLAGSYKGRPPPFPVGPASAHRLGVVGGTTARLQKIVREAQRNFQFATIYEQRKTSNILIAGFTNLGDAIYGLGTRLEQSIDGLGDQINDLSTSMAAMNEQVVDAVKGVSSAINSADKHTQVAMSDQAARQEKAVKMLDNIQRRRVPSPFADH